MRIETDLYLRVVCGGDRTAGGVELSPDALDAVLEIAAKIENPKREKKDLTGENLDKYIAAARRVLKQNQSEIDKGGKLITKRAFAAAIELGESTVRSNPDLNNIYEDFKAMNSRIAPATVNNDYDYDDEF